MPYLVTSLLEGKAKPLCVEKNTNVVDVLTLMIEHDYSQLPVLDHEGKPIGMVNYETIVKAIKNLGAKPDELVATNVRESIHIFTVEDDLFDILDKVRDSNAVLISDQDRIVGILTSYDANEYFRRRAQDLMYIEDIEEMLKDFILASFTNGENDADEEAIRLAIRKITSQEKEWKSRYKRALLNYLGTDRKNSLDTNRLQESFSLLYQPPEDIEFNSLDLFHYIELLLSKDRWDFYRPIFNLESEHLRVLLSKVRKTRNDLAHFRGEVTQNQRNEILECRRLLSNFKTELERATEKISDHSLPVQDMDDLGKSFETVEEEQETFASRYAPLAHWLLKQPSSTDRLPLSFEEVSRIIEGDLPPSAFEHRAWWANDSVRHSHSILWLDAGWRVASVNINAQQVTFTRIKDRERLYIDFWTRLMKRLKTRSSLNFREASPDGTSWIVALPVPEKGPQKAVVNFAFALNQRFRMELYIDTGIRERNKEIFDSLRSRKEKFEDQIGAELAWERLDHRRATRIALYHSGSIQDEQHELDQLIAWVESMIFPFYSTLGPPASELLSDVSR